MKDQTHLFVRADRCVGCHACELACAVAHSRSKTLAGAIRESPPPQKRIFAEAVESARMPVHCRHCEDAPCVRVCPTSALAADAELGLVLYDSRRCVGCFLCAMACPFGVIRPDAELRRVVKCDRCPELPVPACVDACRTGALLFVTEGGYERLRRREVVLTWPWM